MDVDSVDTIKAGTDGVAVATGIMAFLTEAVPLAAAFAAFVYTAFRIADYLHSQRQKGQFPFGPFGK